MRTLPLMLALLLGAPLGTLAQEVWRCGADGSSYSAVPCAEGRIVATSAARPAADVQAAQAAAAGEARLADGLQRERRQQELRSAGSGLGSLSAARPARVVRPLAAGAAKKKVPTLQRPPAAADTWTAAVPGSRRKKG